MSRGLTSAVLAQIAGNRLRMAILVKAEFDSGTLTLTTAGRDLSWDSLTWAAAGGLLAIAQVEETDEVAARGSVIELSGMPASLLSIAYDEDYQGRACTIYLAFLDDDHAVLSNPVVLFRGAMDVIEDSEDGETIIFRLTVENALIALERAPDRTYTDADQQELYPGDTFFKQVPDIVNLEIELDD